MSIPNESRRLPVEINLLEREGVGRGISIQDTVNGSVDSLSQPRCFSLPYGEVGMATDPGGRDGKNQDAVGMNRDGVIVVADGAGGNDAGDVAALVAVETIREKMKGEILVVPPQESHEAYGAYFRFKTNIEAHIEACEAARYTAKFNPNKLERLLEIKADLDTHQDRWVLLPDLADFYSECDEKNVGSGAAAITFAFVDRDGVFQVFQAGDTVFHICHEDGTFEEILTHGYKNKLFHGLFNEVEEADRNVLARWHSFQLKKGDTIVMCSDGVRIDRNMTANRLVEIVKEQKKPEKIIKKVEEETTSSMESGNGKLDNRAIFVLVYNGKVFENAPTINVYQQEEISIVDTRPDTSVVDPALVNDPDITVEEPKSGR